VQAGYGWLVFACTVLLFVAAFCGLAFSIFPYVVMDQMTVWQAASSTQALTVLFYAVVITVPAILAYTAFMYRVFWGKTRELTY
jgi:cytochrome d ubiquinol oxidase subunit II